MSAPRGKNDENRVRSSQQLNTDSMASLAYPPSFFEPFPGEFNLYGDSMPKTSLAYGDNNDLCDLFSGMKFYDEPAVNRNGFTSTPPPLPDSLEEEPTTSYRNLFYNRWTPAVSFSPALFGSDYSPYSSPSLNPFANHGTDNNLFYDPFHLPNPSFPNFYPRSSRFQISNEGDVLRGNRGNSQNVAGTGVPGGSADDVAMLRSMVAVDGGALALAKDQNGSRYLQAVIEGGKCEAVRIILEGMIENVVEVMVNPFGNHVVQKLITVCERDQILRIILMLTNVPGRFLRVSLDVYGTRVVQKLIEKADTRQQLSLLSSSIQCCFLDLTKDTNGNHVIQRCLQCFNCLDNQFLFCAAARFCVDVATHQHGCCVLKNCLTYSVGKYQDMMVSEICKHGLLLAQDPYGNYVVQHVIELHIPDASRKLLSQFRGKFRYLSMQKFSSHVVEIFLKHVAESRSIIIGELLQESYAVAESRPTISQFGLLLQDPYANYVIQRALQVTKGALHSSLVEAISRHEDLRTSIFCKKIFSSNLLKK